MIIDPTNGVILGWEVMARAARTDRWEATDDDHGLKQLLLIKHYDRDNT